MSSDHDHRVTVLTAAAKAKSQTKTTAADQAIRALLKHGEAINFQTVARQAGVSHAFLYNHPELRGRIEHLRARHHPTPEPTNTATPDNTIMLALTNQIEHLKKQHRTEVQALRTALEQAHGENLDLRRELTRHGWTSSNDPSIAKTS